MQIRRLGERDVKSRTIGEIVMQALFALDHVAYVRFASVYQDFKMLKHFVVKLSKCNNVNTNYLRFHV
jgi:transcriptional repressor NrdR